MSTRIVVIDDDAAIRDLLARYLRSQGYDADTSEDGSAGLARCRRSPPDLVLCDLRMPGTDGLEVLSALREELPDLPVVVVSGTGELDDAIQALKLGASDYVTKPIEDLAVLGHAIGRALERTRLIVENRAYRVHLEKANTQLALSLRQLEEDERLGKKLQFALMPRQRVRFGEYECSRYVATSAFLSGDFIDYFAIDDDRFGFYMADVSGHGVASAVITVLLKSYVGRYLENFRRFADGTILDPAALLGTLNRDFLAGEHGKYLTMFYGVVTCSRATLRFTNGGQFPFPLLFDGTKVSEIGGRSPAVGLFDTARYTSDELPIPPDFALRLFSDGVLEVLLPPDLQGRKTVLRDLAAGTDRDAGQLAHALGLVEERALPDDASVLSVRRMSDVNR